MAFEDPDNLPRPKKTPWAPVDVYPLSVEEMREYIAHCRGEIERAEQEIARKTALRSAGDQLFKR